VTSPLLKNKTVVGAYFCAYIDAGMTLFPCSGYTKIPTRKGFLECSFDPEFVPEDHNYGVLLSQRYLVIDCDPRSYDQGDKPLTRLFSDLQLPPDLFKQTFTVKTPRGGYHIYFSKLESVLLVNRLKDFSGLEFKTKFIMACGSYIEKTEKGEKIEAGYAPVYGGPSQIMKAPQILLAKLLKPKEESFVLNTTVTPDNPADIRAFIRHCQTVEPAVEGDDGDLRTYQVACQGREYGLSQATVLAVMTEHFNPRCDPPWSNEDLSVKVQNAYVYATRTPQGIRSVQNEFPDTVSTGTESIKIKYQQDGKGNLKKNMFNLQMFFEFPAIHEDKETKQKKTLTIPPIGNFLKYDQFAHRIIWSKPAPWYKATGDWSDEDAVVFKSILSDQISIDFPVDQIHEVAVVCANKRAFHPVRDYLESIHWDGVSRLDNWLSRYCGALDTEYSRYIGRKVLVAAVARVYRPGCKFDHVLVTEGAQGIGKSYMWEILASPWFTDAPLHIQDKSAVEVMQGKWVIELAEMDALSKYESQTIKGFLTRTEDRCRMAWGRHAKNFPRQNIFVGSINPEQTGWLKDRTGNRRFWPVAVTRIDLKELKAVKDMLWAEALLAFEKGENLYVADNHMQEVMREEVANRMQEDPWFGLIEDYLHHHVLDYLVNDQIVVLPVELYTRCIGGNAATFRVNEANRIASSLKILGFEKARSVLKMGYVYIKTYVREI
jgi:hypothetical protein